MFYYRSTNLFFLIFYKCILIVLLSFIVLFYFIHFDYIILILCFHKLSEKFIGLTRLPVGPANSKEIDSCFTGMSLFSSFYR